MSDNITKLISALAGDSFNAELNFRIAEEYEKLGQNASAISFYLRSAEYGEDKNLVYCSLLKVGICLERQGERDWNVSNSFLQAVQYLPNRPEAYYLLSKFYERSSNWQECLTNAELGLFFSEETVDPLPSSVGYPGKYALTFQKAVSSWSVDRQEDSKNLFVELSKMSSIDPEYRTLVTNNMKNLGLFIDKIAIILPVRDAGTGRAQRLIACLNSWSKMTEGLSDVHIIIDDDDIQYFGYLQEQRNNITVHVRPAGFTLMEKINSVAPDLAHVYNYMAFIGDDIVFKTEWESAFINYLKSVPAGLVYGNTLDLPDHIDWGTHPCITTNMVRALGFYGCPAVAHNFFDNFWSEIAKELGTEKFMPDVIMDHRRTGWTPDSIYHKVSGLLEPDREKYAEYKRTQFDSDLQKIKDYINAG